MGEPKTTFDSTEPGDLALILSFAARMRLGIEGLASENFSNRSLAEVGVGENAGRLIEADELAEFAGVACGVFEEAERKDVLRRALDFAVPIAGESVERSFLVLFSALETTLTFARLDDEYKVIPRDEFLRLERELKNWLKQHPALADKSERRAQVYEKTRELNRLPFSRVLTKFCERRGVDLSDLWPLVGRLDSWPLLEIRHRLVHGDPFHGRPTDALRCAREHLRWSAERMLLNVLGWPVERSSVSPEQLGRSQEMYRRWPEVREHLCSHESGRISA